MYEFYDHIRLDATGRIAPEDAARQTRTAREILHRLGDRPGLILADEVGMGKTFVALAVGVSTALANRGRRPVVVMTPPGLKEKWEADFKLFREKCLDPDAASRITCGTAQRAEEFLKLLDDPPHRRKSVIFVTHGAMSRGLQDPWVKLALIARALRRRRDGDRIRRALSRNDTLPQLLPDATRRDSPHTGSGPRNGRVARSSLGTAATGGPHDRRAGVRFDRYLVAPSYGARTGGRR